MQFFKEKGQATVEYILLLVLVLGIGGLFVAPGGLAKNLMGWANSLIGYPDNGKKSYYGCLMEQGLLPGTALEKEGEHFADCSRSRADAANLVTGEGQDASSEFSSRNTGSSSSSKDSSKSSQLKDRDSSSKLGEDSEDSDSPGSSNRASSKKRGAKNPASLSPDHFLINNLGGNEEEDLHPDSFKLKKKKSKKQASPGAKPIIIIAGEDGEDDEDYGGGSLYLPWGQQKDQKKHAPLTFTVKGKAQATKSGASEEEDINLVKKRDKASVQANEDAGLNLPKFLKWLIIIAMILAIVVIIGFQILEFTNSE